MLYYILIDNTTEIGRNKRKKKKRARGSSSGVKLQPEEFKELPRNWTASKREAERAGTELQRDALAHNDTPQRTPPAYTARHGRGKSDPALAASAKTRRSNIVLVLVDFYPTERPADGAVDLCQGAKAGHEAFPLCWQSWKKSNNNTPALRNLSMFDYFCSMASVRSLDVWRIA